MSNHAPFVPWMHSLLDRMKELYNKPNARTIAEALPDITGALHYRGTKATVADLPSSGNTTGDVWHITEDGSEWAWDGSEWQDLGGSVTPASIVTATGQMTDEQAAATAQNIGIAPLRLTATPTAGPSGNTLMSGTWSGATWEQVVEAIQASRLIQVDVAPFGKITLLYNLGSETNAGSIAYVYNVGNTLYNVFVELLINNEGYHKFYLSIINARTETVNVDDTDTIITPAANTVYKCGELTSLTISNPPATGKYSIIFFSGSTPTTIVGIENFEAEANKRYKITVEDNYATYDSWPYTP